VLQLQHFVTACAAPSGEAHVVVFRP